MIVLVLAGGVIGIVPSDEVCDREEVEGERAGSVGVLLLLIPVRLNRSRRLWADALGRRFDRAGTGGGGILGVDGRSRSESYGYIRYQLMYEGKKESEGMTGFG